MADQTNHDFRGITTTGRVAPSRVPKPTEAWGISGGGRLHTLVPANADALFKVIVRIEGDGVCHVSVVPKTDGHSDVRLLGKFYVESFSTPTEIADLRKKAKAAAKRLLNQQAALL